MESKIFITLLLRVVLKINNDGEMRSLIPKVSSDRQHCALSTTQTI